MGDQVVDHLSKHEMDKVASLVPGMRYVSSSISQVLRNWIRKPVPNRGLGREVLVELERQFPVKVGRDYRQDLWSTVLSRPMEDGRERRVIRVGLWKERGQYH